MNSKSEKDIRWIQRFEHFLVAFDQLKSAIELSKVRELSDLEKQGLIKAFEFSHELSWNVFKDYFEYQGPAKITGSRDATREAFSSELIEDGDSWMAMILSRNQTSHSYNRKTANEIIEDISNTYFNLFVEFSKKMSELSKK
jgi:nucleotidyltransferase substrate binding protein (TIGR01987 family)